MSVAPTRLARTIAVVALLGTALLGEAKGAVSLGPVQSALVGAAVKAAADQGLPADRFPADTAAAAVALASAQHGGRAPVSAFPRDWAIRPAPYDAAGEFARAVASDHLGAWLDNLAPPDSRYQRLAAAYARYRVIAAHGGWPALPAAAHLQLGDAGPEVDALRARLAIEDAAVPPPPRDDPAHRRPAFDLALASAVMRAQARYGLEADGRVGAATLAALNVPVQDRLLQMRANLERWRWVPRTLPTLRVEVNTADAMLELFDGKSASMTMRAIVGRAGKATPMFADDIRAVVFNPPWNVPADIAAKEIWPKIRKDPGYRAREGFVERPGGGLQQLPGPRCALGVVKFDLSNSFGVYLHDTPAHGLFALDHRALSHGCMRLADPTDLAKRILAADPSWPETAIDLAILSGKTTRAPLRAPVPVYVFYWTAFVDDDGQLQFRPDIYGWDKTLAAMMARAGQPL